jgi:type I restriction enzyme R subunit
MTDRSSSPPSGAALNEARTRKALIDPALERAGWDLQNPQQVRFEIPVDDVDAATWQALQQKLAETRATYQITTEELPAGVCDYALYRPNGDIIAIVEAKKTSIDPRLAQAQVEFYVTEIAKRQNFRPFAFLTNGHDIYFWDIGSANKRLVAGFFSPADLDNLLFIRQNQHPLNTTQINNAITDRSYQHEAVRRVGEAFTQGKRKALLVMATGTGKTRVVMSLVDMFLRTNQARRVLFVADRDALVEQALTEGFQQHLPHEPCERITSRNVGKLTGRLFAVTLQSLSRLYNKLSPGFFDLIIFDEVHRSIFNQWKDVLSYFDARMIGLTATPADFVDRNTFLAFECDDGTPTFLYSFKEAVDEGYLVDYWLYEAKTKFQRRGIKGVDLSEEERNALIEQGVDPDELDFSGTDLERKVSNRDTLRRQWEEIWQETHKDQSGQQPGKTIVFALSQEHALRLAEVFEEMYPQFPGLVSVITHTSNYKGQPLRQFKKQDRPRIAITVDLLETGVDVPEVVNLVFLKPVQSYIKLWQMIGRGTRSHAACKHLEWLPNGEKKGFLILDFWENDFAKAPDAEATQSLPVLVSLFNTRLKVLEQYLNNQQSPECQRVIADLRAQVARIPTEAFSVKKIYPQIEQAWSDGFWRLLTKQKLDFLRMKVGPLLRYAAGVDVDATTFTSKVERLKLQIVTNKNTAASAQSIAEDVSRLPDFVFNDPQREQATNLGISPEKLQAATPEQLTQMVDLLADQMKNRRDKPNPFLLLDLPDMIDQRGYILLHGGSEPVYVDEYRKRVDERVFELAANHPTIAAIESGEPVSDSDLIALERTLRQELGGKGLELSEDNIRRAYGMKVGSLMEFLRQFWEIAGIPDYRDIVDRQFEEYITRHAFNAQQIKFLRTVKTVLARKRRLHLADLYDPPLTSFGDDAADRWFTDDERADILTFAETLSVAGDERAD